MATKISKEERKKITGDLVSRVQSQFNGFVVKYEHIDTFYYYPIVADIINVYIPKSGFLGSSLGMKRAAMLDLTDELKPASLWLGEHYQSAPAQEIERLINGLRLAFPESPNLYLSNPPEDLKATYGQAVILNGP